MIYLLDINTCLIDTYNQLFFKIPFNHGLKFENDKYHGLAAVGVIY